MGGEVYQKGMSVSATVLFKGNVTHKLDPKSRVAIPANWRAAQGAVLTLIEASGSGYPIIKCYTEAAFEQKMDDIRRQATAAGAEPGDIDRYIGIITGRSFEAEVSGQGKLLIPKAQRERLHLEDSAVLVGRGDYFEIWAPGDYAAADSDAALAQLALDKRFHILS